MSWRYSKKRDGDNELHEMQNRVRNTRPTNLTSSVRVNDQNEDSRASGTLNYSRQHSNPFDDIEIYPERDYVDVLDRWQIYNDRSDYSSPYHRTTSIHRNMRFREPTEAGVSRTFPRFVELEGRRRWMTTAGNKKSKTSAELEQHASNIVNRMEQDGILMEDSPESEQLRREALRDMPQCLTVKRIIKKKLNKSVSQHSKRKPLSLYKRLKYRLSIQISKMQNSLKSLVYTFELWYSSLKTIEGHFGSGVATYFKFFRWLFIMNSLITCFVIAFLVIPQLLYIHVEPVNSGNNNNRTLIYDNNNTNAITPEALKWRRVSTIDNNAVFEFVNIFTGEGFFTNTTLYYGFYTNQSVNLISNQIYHMPYAYFFTLFCMYIISFIFISVSMARSYRRSFIETQGGLKNVYAHKIFCGWDYSIATEEAADLKSSSIYNELKEILSDSQKDLEHLTFWQKFWTFVIQVAINILMVIKLISIGYLLWYLLDRNITNEEDKDPSVDVGVIIAVSINVVMLLFPPLFSIIIRYEDYKHPRASLYVTLIRTFLLKSVIIGVFLGFWLTHSDIEECWETSIGQHAYRLIIFDFLFHVVIGTLFQVIRYFIYKKLWRKIGVPEFNIAENTLQLLYNQTLFWVGLYFSPLLSLVVVIKLWCTWYVRRTFLLHCCKPSSKSWRAVQTHTWFLILSFLSLLLVIITYGYILVEIRTSNCGPFRNYRYMYEMITRGLLQLEQNHIFWRVLLYLTKPGTVALILIALCVVVYYLRAKAFAQKSMVNILREMLILEAKDKEFLLKNISKVTEGQWQYNLKNNGATSQPFLHTSPDLKNRKLKNDYDYGDVDVSIHNSPEDFLISFPQSYASSRQ